MKTWSTKGFEAFSRGKLGNGGQNIYISRKGVLQRIHQTDVTRNGYMDLIYCNSQSHEEWVPVRVYADPVNHPEEFTELDFGGAYDAVVADLNNSGHDSVVWGCYWDGMTTKTLSWVCYPSENGPSGQYMCSLPTPYTTAVAAGDFDGDGNCDIALYSANLMELRLIFQRGFGDTPENMITLKLPDLEGQKMTAYRFPGDKCATLFMSLKNGSVVKFTSLDPEKPEYEEVFPADPDYRKVVNSWDNYNQAVDDAPPRLQIIRINGIDYLTVFRQKHLLLYPVAGNCFGGEPIKIDCPNARAVAAGDVYGRGCTDLLVAAQDQIGHREYSYLYHGDKGCFTNDNRMAIRTYRACDAALENFSGGRGLDILLLQGHTFESFDNPVLIFPTSNAEPGELPRPAKIMAHDSFRIVTLRDKQNRPHLLVGNHNSGSWLGDPDNVIYIGGPDGFSPDNKITLPGYGSVTAICADLNDNGRPDIVFGNAAEISPWRDPGSYIFYQKEDGSYDRTPAALRTYRTLAVVCGDLNRDGYLDLVFTGFDNNVLKIYFGSENGYTEENSQEIIMKDGELDYRSCCSLALADLNGNGYLDIIATQARKHESFILWGGPDGYSWENKQILKVSNICYVKLADLNGDGYLDLILSADTATPGLPWNSFLYIYWGGPDGYSDYRRQQLPCLCGNGIAVADFNNDGLPDIFVCSYEDGYNRDLPSYIYWNSPKGFSRTNRTEIPTHAGSGCCAGDFNNDGYIDIAVGNHKYNTRHICESEVFYNGPDGFDIMHPVKLPSCGVHGMCQQDPGNLMDRSFNEYYESEVHEIPEGYGIKGFEVSGTIPHQCQVYAEFRCADTPEELAQEPWAGPTAGNSFKPLQCVEKQRFTGKYMQYRLNLWAYNSLNTPRITEVVINFEEL